MKLICSRWDPTQAIQLQTAKIPAQSTDQLFLTAPHTSVVLAKQTETPSKTECRMSCEWRKWEFPLCLSTKGEQNGRTESGLSRWSRTTWARSVGGSMYSTCGAKFPRCNSRLQYAHSHAHPGEEEEDETSERSMPPIQHTHIHTCEEAAAQSTKRRRMRPVADIIEWATRLRWSRTSKSVFKGINKSGISITASKECEHLFMYVVALDKIGIHRVLTPNDGLLCLRNKLEGMEKVSGGSDGYYTTHLHFIRHTRRTYAFTSV